MPSVMLLANGLVTLPSPFSVFWGVYPRTLPWGAVTCYREPAVNSLLCWLLPLQPRSPPRFTPARGPGASDQGQPRTQSPGNESHLPESSPADPPSPGPPRGHRDTVFAARFRGRAASRLPNQGFSARKRRNRFNGNRLQMWRPQYSS